MLNKVVVLSVWEADIVGDDAEERNGTLLMTSDSQELGDSNGTINVSIDGESGKIAFNGKYLQEFMIAFITRNN